jgi:hypothetical protein
MPADDPRSAEDRRRREADAALRRLAQDNGSFGLPQIGWSREEPTDDAAERWGRRAGRALWVIALIVVIYLIVRLFVLAPV